MDKLKFLQIDIDNIKEKRKRDKCISLFEKAYKTNQLTEKFFKVVEKLRKNQEPYNICTNKVSIGQNPIELYNKNDLLLINDEDSNIYCFDKNDITYLKETKTNPFNGKKLDKDVLDSLIYDESIPIYPLNEAIEYVFGNKHCPVYVNTIIKPILTNIVYYVPVFTPNSIYRSNIKEIKTLKDFPTNVQVSPFFFSSITGVPTYVYKLTLKKYRHFLNFTEYINKQNIEKFETIYDPTTRETQKYPAKKITLKPLIYSILDKYVINNIQIPKNYVDEFKKLKIIPKNPIKVYRGLAWDKSDIRKPNNIRVGEDFPIVSDIQQSWSTNICTPELYARRKKYGIILSCILKPDQILLDIRQIKIKFINQSEIISLPGVFDCKIEKILYTENNNNNMGYLGRDDLTFGWLY